MLLWYLFKAPVPESSYNSVQLFQRKKEYLLSPQPTFSDEYIVLEKSHFFFFFFLLKKHYTYI